MPCILLTGHPCSGKTTIAEKFRERALLLPNIERVVIINEESECPKSPDAFYSKQALYEKPLDEKKTRGALKAAFDRQANQYGSSDDVNSIADESTLILLDSLNYIKGFRYELHCISKGAQQRHGVVWIQNDGATVKQWNEQAKHYNPELLQELMQRYEPPDDRNRWDQPLYRVILSEKNQGIGQSVYNMHNVNEALLGARGQVLGSMNDAADSTTSTAAAALPKPKKSAFKRKTKKLKESTPSPELGAETATRGAYVNPCNTEETATPETAPLLPLHEQIDHILKSFFQAAQPLSESMATRAHHASDLILHRADTVSQRVVTFLLRNCAQNTDTSAAVHVPFRIQDGQPLTVPWKIPPTACASCVPWVTAELGKALRQKFVKWIQYQPPKDDSERGLALLFLEQISQAVE